MNLKEDIAITLYGLEEAFYSSPYRWIRLSIILDFFTNTTIESNEICTQHILNYPINITSQPIRACHCYEIGDTEQYFIVCRSQSKCCKNIFRPFFKMRERGPPQYKSLHNICFFKAEF
jgi:hypothetical protein